MSYILLVALYGYKGTRTGATFQLEFKTMEECQKASIVVKEKFDVRDILCMGVRK